MAKKSYNYAQLEAVAQEMRADPDMVYYYEYQKPVTVSPTGEILDLVGEFGELRTSGRGWPIDESWIAGAAIGAAAAGSKAIARMPRMAQIYCFEYVYSQDVLAPGDAGMMRWLRPDAPKIIDAAKQMMTL
jgi:pyruvate/2-oxoglutarate/acetoin dehydrogenase E1 component